jgi:translation initiation factor 4B
LNLAKRTVSEAPDAATPASSTSSKPNPFGAARPIDTATREKEIEEKRQLEIRQKKEADDKAREERKTKDAAEKPTPKAATSSTTIEKTSADDETGDNNEAAEQDEDANGEIVDDKAVKPQEIVRDPPKSEGAWRRKSNTPADAEGGTTEQLEDDGWSTVTKTVKNPKKPTRGGPPARAIAS